MTDPEIIEMICRHYADRGFPGPSIQYLRSLLSVDLAAGSFSAVGSLAFKSPVKFSSLERCFPVPSQPPRTNESYAEPDAIFSFAFGYRLKSRAAPGTEARLPGQNNRALAAISRTLKLLFGVPLYAQFEISDALDDMTEVRADYSTPAEDIGTKRVIEHFLAEINRKNQPKPNKVIVVAHQHHVARCILILRSDFRITAIPSVDEYSQYDPQEAQPRVRSPEEFIASDFVSMASHGPWS
jgi:hypothetical protein